MKKGKFIVLEGIDGSGKKTQSRLLLDRLRTEGLETEFISFPQYGTPSAYFIERYLAGDYGPPGSLNPRMSSTFYACDRHDASKGIREWLDRGRIVVADRYTPSNMAHQGGKVRNSMGRDRLISWIEELEFGIMGIPKPDRVILLYVPTKITQALIEERGEKKDAHEVDFDHLENASRTYIELAERFRWNVIDCAPNSQLLSIEEVHKIVWSNLQDLLF